MFNASKRSSTLKYNLMKMFKQANIAFNNIKKRFYIKGKGFALDHNGLENV